jgi:folate-binding protein YgfZ
MHDPASIDGAVALDHWGLIRARGADAAGFLQSQLTNDVLGLDAAHARWAGWCSAKGRLLASFLVWRDAADDFALACSADLLAPTLKRLTMFVLRAKCRLSDAGAESTLFGVAGQTAARLAGALAPLGRAPLADGATVIRLPDAAGVPRALVEAAAGAAAPGDAPPLATSTWRWLEVRAGVAFVEAATADRFVPQMVNHEIVGAVDFQKGCYPGQEVVARSQYRGTVKRRAFVFDAERPLAAGQEVFHDADPGQPAGMVVMAAPAPDGGWSALVEVKLAALEGGELRAGSTDGAPLVPAGLPYALPAPAGEPA